MLQTWLRDAVRATFAAKLELVIAPVANVAVVARFWMVCASEPN